MSFPLTTQLSPGSRVKVIDNSDKRFIATVISVESGHLSAGGRRYSLLFDDGFFRSHRHMSLATSLCRGKLWEDSSSSEIEPDVIPSNVDDNQIGLMFWIEGNPVLSVSKRAISNKKEVMTEYCASLSSSNKALILYHYGSSPPGKFTVLPSTSPLLKHYSDFDLRWEHTGSFALRVESFDSSDDKSKIEGGYLEKAIADNMRGWVLAERDFKRGRNEVSAIKRSD